MADVFISYKSDDRGLAARASDAFTRLGLSTFFDVEIPVGDQWDELIEAELEAARAVVVLWSPRSVESRWVRLEARSGLARGILCPVIIEDCDIPLEFRDIQAAFITDFSKASDALNRLTSKVLACCEKPPSTNPASTSVQLVEPQPIRVYEHYVSCIRRIIEICDFVSLAGSVPATATNQAELHKAFSRLKYEIGQLESAERRVFKTQELFVQTRNAKDFIWEAAGRTFPWPIFDSFRRSGLKASIDEASYSLSLLYGDLRLDVGTQEDADEMGERNERWFDGVRLSDEGVSEIHKQFAAGKTIYGAAKHIGISYRAAALRYDKWKRSQKPRN